MRGIQKAFYGEGHEGDKSLPRKQGCREKRASRKPAACAPEVAGAGERVKIKTSFRQK